MSSLHLISHHLFVAAIGSEDDGQARPARRDTPGFEAANYASAVPLEVLDSTQPLPVGSMRTLRVSAGAGAQWQKP